MSAAKCDSSLPNIQADDEEIKRYAKLLDSLGIGLAVFSSDATLCLNNLMAGKLFGEIPPRWMTESGQTIPAGELPQNLVLRTSQPVVDQIMTLTNSETKTSWLKINALPVFAENGCVRRVLLTLTDVGEQKILRREVERLSVHDPLTGVFTQQHVMHLLENEIQRARRYGTPFTLAQIDLDLFLPFCAEHGQDVGDSMLGEIGKLLVENMREIDIAGRIGNDEFLLILPNVPLKDSMAGLERLRALIEAREFTSAGLKITISGGITEYTGENSATLIERSRSLLIHARESGRNRFCLDGAIL